MQQDAPKVKPTSLADAFTITRAKQREAQADKKREQMEHALATGDVTGHIGIADAYAASREQALKAQEEQRAAANAPENNTVEAWRSHPIARGLRLPANDPRALEEKHRIINGGQS